MIKLKNLLNEDKLKVLNRDINNVWNRIKNDINKRFNSGYATCTYATKAIIDNLSSKYDIMAIDGTYDGEAHWFPVITYEQQAGKHLRIIADLGNNIKYVNSSKIKPIIIPFPSSKYKSEEYLTPRKYISYFNHIKDF